MNKHDEEEAERIYQALLNAVPMGVCFGNVIVALNQLSMEFAIIMGEREDNDYENYKKGNTAHLN